MEHSYYVYILASRKNGTLYVGVMNDLARRVGEHKSDLVAGFTKRYHVHRLVYYEKYEFIYDAMQREKRIKEWKRTWKVELIEGTNLEWKDLTEEW
jgi:putative endonuclease